MRQIAVLCVLTLFPLVVLSQDAPEWEIHGGYQFTRFDIGAVQDAADSVTIPAGLPRVDIGRNLNMSGGSFSLQQNANSWWGGILDFSAIYASKHSDLSQQAIDLGLVPPGTNVTATFRPTVVIFGGGPQFTYRKHDKVQPFVRVMAGIAHADLKPDTLNQG